jgi:hypothetical protein
MERTSYASFLLDWIAAFGEDEDVQADLELSGIP